MSLVRSTQSIQYCVIIETIFSRYTLHCVNYKLEKETILIQDRFKKIKVLENIEIIVSKLQHFG